MTKWVLLLSAFVLAIPASALDLDRIAIDGRLSYFMPTQSSDTFDANFGGGEGIMLGGGGIWEFDNGLTIEGALDYYSESGDRVYVGGGQSQSSGFDTKITIIPITGTVGWTFLRDGAWSPMVGAGVGYHLVDVDGGEADNVIGYHVLAGAQFLRGGNFGIGAELKFSSAPDALGHGGTSLLYGEDDVGGITLTFKALWNYRK